MKNIFNFFWFLVSCLLQFRFYPLQRFAHVAALYCLTFYSSRQLFVVYYSYLYNVHGALPPPLLPTTHKCIYNLLGMCTRRTQHTTPICCRQISKSNRQTHTHTPTETEIEIEREGGRERKLNLSDLRNILILIQFKWMCLLLFSRFLLFRFLLLPSSIPRCSVFCAILTFYLFLYKFLYSK